VLDAPMLEGDAHIKIAFKSSSAGAVGTDQFQLSYSL
jgi:hypothetical protein